LQQSVSIAERKDNFYEKCKGAASQKAKHLENVALPDYVSIQIIDIDGSARRGEKLDNVKDIVIHYVGNPGTTAKQNHNYYANPVIVRPKICDDVVVFSNPLIDGHFCILSLFRRYHLQVVFHMKLSVLKPIFGYIHLLTPPKVQSFTACL